MHFTWITINNHLHTVATGYEHGFNSKMIITSFRHTTVYIWLPYVCKPGKESACKDQGYGEYCLHLFFLLAPALLLSPRVSHAPRSQFSLTFLFVLRIYNVGRSLNHESGENVGKVHSRDLFSLALIPCPCFLFSHYLIAFLVDTKSYLVWYVQQRLGLE